MKSKKDLVNIINNYKMINSDIENLPNGEKYIWAKFSSNRTREDRMTINDLAKEMREGFRLVNNRIDEVKQEVAEIKQEVAEIKQEVIEIKQDVADLRVYVDVRFDKIETRLDVIEDKLERNNIK